MSSFRHAYLHIGVAPNSTALIVGRAIAGVGGAGIASGSYTLIAFAARPQQRAAFTGLIGASYGIASVIGPLLGGVFAEKATWRYDSLKDYPQYIVANMVLQVVFLYQSSYWRHRRSYDLLLLPCTSSCCASKGTT